MSLKDIRSECSEVAATLQPYVDGELSDEEQETVAEHLSGCTPCRAAVQEQLWVRATIRAIERDPAPQSLRAQILRRLDEVDREAAADAPASAESGGWSRVWLRLRDALRGGLIMVPAGAVAVALFLVARSGVTPTEPSMANRALGAGAALARPEPAMTRPGSEAQPEPAANDEVLDALADVEPRVGFPVQVASPRASDQVQLVGARVDAGSAPNAERPGAQLRYKVLWEGKPTHVVDHQAPVGNRPLQGTPVSFGGRRYLMGRGDDGRPVLWFERSGVAHMLVHEGARADATAAAPTTGDADYSLLLHFADHSFTR